jgi:hypothetical protein
MSTGNALLTATEGFEPSASGNLPSGQQGVRGYHNHLRTLSFCPITLYHKTQRLG